jgi:probable Rubsico expression protein CbbX
MWGLQLKYLGASMSLLAATVGLVLLWTFLPLLWAVGVTLVSATIVLIIFIGRDAVRQTRGITPQDSVLDWRGSSPGLRRDWTPLLSGRGIRAPVAASPRPDRSRPGQRAGRRARGAPGTGKTTVALKLADLLRRLGYLDKGHLVHAMRDDLVGEYIGHTAPKTKAVLERAMGGVLFIDEAYSLFRSEDSKDYGQECIDILQQVMENDRDKLVVILAGYKDRMDHFFDSNPGMGSRIAHHLDFADYTLDELLAIGQLMLDRSSYYLSDTAAVAFRDFLASDMHQPRFANARSVRNELERSRLRHAYRLAAEPDQGRNMDDLMRLEPPDVGVPGLVKRFT